MEVSTFDVNVFPKFYRSIHGLSIQNHWLIQIIFRKNLNRKQQIVFDDARSVLENSLSRFFRKGDGPES